MKARKWQHENPDVVMKTSEDSTFSDIAFNHLFQTGTVANQAVKGRKKTAMSRNMRLFRLSQKKQIKKLKDVVMRARKGQYENSDDC